MSHKDTFDIKEYSSFFYVLIVIMGLHLGYTIGRDHKKDNVREQQKVEQIKLEQERRSN